MSRFVLDYLPAHPEQTFDCVQLWDVLLESGWKPAPGVKDPMNGLRTTLARLAQLGEIQRVAKGVYQAKKQDRLVAAP